MSLKMPEPDQAVLARRAEIVRDPARHRAGRGRDRERARDAPLRDRRADRLSADAHGGGAAGDDRAGRRGCCAIATTNGIRVVPRGSGTSLSGGALPLADGVLLVMAQVQPHPARSTTTTACAVVQPGVTNLGDHARRSRERGFYYAPDPSSQIACSIGGNVAENSGGVHCLKYGLTTNNVLGIEMVLITGEVIRLGGKHLDSEGYDLLGLMTGSEGLLGVVTEVTVRILQKPETARAVLVGFPSSRGRRALRRRHHRRRHHPGRHGDDGPAGDPRGRGFRPCRLSARCRGAADRRARRAAGRGRPPARARRGDRRAPTGAIDLPRLDIARRSGCSSGPGARPRSRRSAASRPTITAWTAPSRARELPQVLARMRELSEQYGLRVANVFHAGDGNLHPLILYDANKPGELERAEAFGADILRLCVEVGGVLTGEHGVGVEKRDLMPAMFTETDLAQQQRVKCAFDAEGPAQSRQGVSRRCTAAPSSAACMSTPGRWRFRICRGSERAAMTDTLKPRDAKDVEAAVDWALGRGQAARDRRPRLEARASAGRRRRDLSARSLRPLRRHALRAGGAGALGQGRHAARRDRGAARRATTRSSPSSRWTTARCFGAARRARHDRRRARREPLAARAASRRARRAIISSASRRSRAAARRSSPAGAW